MRMDGKAGKRKERFQKLNNNYQCCSVIHVYPPKYMSVLLQNADVCTAFLCIHVPLYVCPFLVSCCSFTMQLQACYQKWPCLSHF